MLIKKKSLIVALVSSFVIASVLVLTLVGYVAYTELKGEELRRAYQGLLQKINAKVYSKYIEIANLDAEIEPQGVLRGKPVIAGLIRNQGNRGVSNILVKVKFLDADGAMLYEVIFRPQEPSLGTQFSIPYLTGYSKVVLKPGSELPFKRILVNCPVEILNELKTGRGFTKVSGRWSGKFASEILSIDFP